ncbi:hypothetical protein [Pseudobdellovibrio exovorus]|nr:hypothetical protein [Pseudobdellovibrio exovorus]
MKKNQVNKNVDPKSEQTEADLYKQAQRSMIEKEWDEIFKNLKVDEEEYKVFLSFGDKMDDSRPRGPGSIRYNKK